MLLGLSGHKKGLEICYDAVNGSEFGDGGVEHGALLAGIAEAMWTQDPDKIATARSALATAAGTEVMVDAVAVSANFHMMTRVADGTGTPLDPGTFNMSEAMRRACDVNGFVSRRDPQGERLRAG